MKRFFTYLKTELKLSVRDMSMVIFAVIIYVLAVSWNHGGGSYDKQTALRR